MLLPRENFFVGFGGVSFIFRKLLDLEKKVATSKPLVKSLSTENDTLKNKVAILTAEVENDKEPVQPWRKACRWRRTSAS